jgi:hypothetical protein
MALNLGSLRRIDTASSDDVRDDETVLVVVKLAEGALAPDYINVRETFGPYIVSAEVSGRDLTRLNHDPAVRSVERSRPLPMIR